MTKGAAVVKRSRQGGTVTKFEVTRAVRESALPSLERLVMLTLADLADMDGTVPAEFSPSLTTLGKQTGLSRSAVADKLGRLEAAGWVVRDAPSVADARSKKARTQYRITVPVVLSLVQDTDQSTTRTSPGDGLVRVTDQPDQDITGHEGWSTVRTSPPHGLVSGLSSPPHGHVPTSSPSEKSSSKQKPRADAEPPEFVEFYEQAYPLKKSRGAARKAWQTNVVKAGVDPAVVIAAARQHRDDPRRNPEFTKYPATWLNQECWKDEPSPPPASRRTSPAGYRNDPNADYEGGWTR